MNPRRPSGFSAGVAGSRTCFVQTVPVPRGDGLEEELLMRVRLLLNVITLAAIMVAIGGWIYPQPAGDPLIEGFRQTEVASVADAIEQLYGRQNYMVHDMRALFKTKFAGPAVTVLLKKEEHKEGAAASQGMIDAIDNSPAGSVYVMVLENGLDYGAVGGLMATTMKVRGFAGAVVDGSIRDLPQIQRIQFPVMSRGVSPGTTVGHYRCVGVNVPVTCAGVRVNPKDIITADEDGVVVVPSDKAAEVLKKAQELDFAEHSTYPFIERFKSLKEAIAKFGRI
jgi:regulator of RNase E activity RraA